MVKFRSISLVVVLVGSFLGGAAFAKGEGPKKGKSPEARFKALDKDGDDKVSLAEFVGLKDGEAKQKAEKTFRKADKNHDGFLSLSEFKAANEKKGGKKPKK